MTMAGKRPTPLKDEPVASLDELQDLLMKSIAATNALNKTICNYTDAQPVSPEKIATAVRNDIQELLEQRQRKFEREEQEAKAQGRLTPQECYERLSADYADVQRKCIAFCDTYKHIGEALKRQEARSRKLETKLDILIAKQDIQEAGVIKTTFPPNPKRFKEVFAYLFKEILLYCLSRAYRSRHVRRFVWICLLCIWLLSVGITCFIAHDNAMMRKEIQRNLPQKELLYNFHHEHSLLQF